MKVLEDTIDLFPLCAETGQCTHASHPDTIPIELSGRHRILG